MRLSILGLTLKNRMTTILTTYCPWQKLWPRERWSAELRYAGAALAHLFLPTKIPGVRAALIHDHFPPGRELEDDHMNIISMGGRTVGPAVAWDLVQTFLEAKYSQEPRHLRRLAKVAAQEASQRP